ncbi:MAG: hypothetical protein JWO98_1023, partial [Frankiales bacterium]|nr:hypothetical protein [Frankiales bacterium]
MDDPLSPDRAASLVQGIPSTVVRYVASSRLRPSRLPHAQVTPHD